MCRQKISQLPAVEAKLQHVWIIPSSCRGTGLRAGWAFPAMQPWGVMTLVSQTQDHGSRSVGEVSPEETGFRWLLVLAAGLQQ